MLGLTQRNLTQILVKSWLDRVLENPAKFSLFPIIGASLLMPYFEGSK